MRNNVKEFENLDDKKGGKTLNSLNLAKRENKTSHWARKERRAGMVPGVLYGKGISNLLFEIGELELSREISSTGEHGIINCNIDGCDHTALLKEVQRDPVTHKILHVDLEEVSEDKTIQSEVPIQYVGEEWIAKSGAILQKEQELVKVSCKADKLPKSIKIDVSKGGLGSVFRYADLEVGEEISIVDDIKGVIASISNEKRVTLESEEDVDEE